MTDLAKHTKQASGKSKWSSIKQGIEFEAVKTQTDNNK